MNKMFNHCQRLEKIDLSSISMDRVESAQCMFEDCYRLSKINLGDNNLECIPDTVAIFSNCNAEIINEPKSAKALDRDLKTKIKMEKANIANLINNMKYN